MGPSEDGSIQYDPAPDNFFFGFHYLAKVQDEIEEATLQQALRQFEESLTEEVDDVMFETSPVDESDLGDNDDFDLTDVHDDGETSLPPLACAVSPSEYTRGSFC